jgi:hypothetical protein
MVDRKLKMGRSRVRVNRLEGNSCPNRNLV